MTFRTRAASLTFGFAMLASPLILSGSPLLAQKAKKTPAAPAAAPATPEPAADAGKAPDRAAAYYHFGLAKIYEEQAVANGRQDMATQAVEQYKLALDADPDSTMLQDGLANLYYRLGRIREAVSAAQEQITKHPEDVDAHTLLGRVYLRSLDDRQGAQPGEMLAAAIHEYETIVKLKPNDLESRLLLGQLYGLNHDSTKAEEQFKAAQKIDGSSEEVVLSLARLYSEQGDNERAAKTLAAVAPDDRSSRENFALAGLYDQLNEPKKAADAYRSVLDEEPDNADAKRGLAAALLKAGQLDEAGKVYGQILGSDPQDAQALIREADIQRQQGKYDQALATLTKAEGLAPDSLELSYNKALVYDALGRFDDSIRTLKAMLAQTASTDGKMSDGDRSNRALFLDRLAIVQREAGKTDDAVASYKQISALGPDYEERGLDGQIDTLRDAHQWAAALAVAKAAADANPDKRTIQLTYARQLADSGKFEQGMKLAQAQLKGTPDDRETLITIADMDVRGKRWNEASQALDKAEALAQKPDEKLFVYYYRGSLAERQKLYDEAESSFKKGLAIDPDNAAISNDYGYMLAERGVKLDEAIAMIKKAVNFDPQNGAYLDSLAWAYYKDGQYALAEDYSRKAVQREGSDPSILSHLGDIYAHNGKLSLAVAEWEKSVKSYNSSLAPDADPEDVAKVQKKLESARVKLAHAGK